MLAMMWTQRGFPKSILDCTSLDYYATHLRDKTRNFNFIPFKLNTQLRQLSCYHKYNHLYTGKPAYIKQVLKKKLKQNLLSTD